MSTELSHVLRGRAGAIHIRYRLYLSNAYGDMLSEIGGWDSGTITMSNESDATWQLELGIRATDAFDPWADYVMAACEVLIDGEWQRFPLGLYRFMVPSADYLEEFNYWTLTGYSPEQLLATDEPQDGFKASAGEGALATVKSMLLARNIPDRMILFPVEDVAISSDRFYDPVTDEGSTDYLSIANDILANAGFYALWTDNGGRFVTRRISTQSSRAPDFHYGREDLAGEGAEGFIGDSVSDDWDDERFANKIIVISEDVNQDPPITAVAENHNPNSRASIENAGRVVVKKVTMSSASDQATANTLAQAQLEAASGFYRKISLTILPDPRRRPRESGVVEVFSEGKRVIDGRWSVQSLEIDMDSDAPQPWTMTLSRVEKI